MDRRKIPLPGKGSKKMANKVNKIYITLAAAIPTTLGAADRRVLAFNATQTTVGTVASDDFGTFLQDRTPLAGSAPAIIRAKNRVSAWFQPGGRVTLGAAQVGVDFIAATGIATTAASIDPIATRHFRIRAVINRLITAAEFARTTVNGAIFVQRQHSMEA